MKAIDRYIQMSVRVALILQRARVTPGWESSAVAGEVLAALGLDESSAAQKAAYKAMIRVAPSAQAALDAWDEQADTLRSEASMAERVSTFENRASE
jgi:hypothetical protein